MRIAHSPSFMRRKGNRCNALGSKICCTLTRAKEYYKTTLHNADSCFCDFMMPHIFSSLKLFTGYLLFSRINLFRQQQWLIHASSFKLIVVPFGEPDIREAGTDISVAALCVVGELVFIHYTTYRQ